MTCREEGRDLESVYVVDGSNDRAFALPGSQDACLNCIKETHEITQDHQSILVAKIAQG